MNKQEKISLIQNALAQLKEDEKNVTTECGKAAIVSHMSEYNLMMYELTKEYVPCVGCDGKGAFVNSAGDDVINCEECSSTGRQEVSKEQAEEFWKHFKREDF